MGSFFAIPMNTRQSSVGGRVAGNGAIKSLQTEQGASCAGIRISAETNCKGTLPTGSGNGQRGRRAVREQQDTIIQTNTVKRNWLTDAASHSSFR